jgi:hypothetical protein
MAELPTYKYDLPENRVNKLCAVFLRSVPFHPASRFGCYILDSQDKYSDLGRYIEGKIFNETFSNDPLLMMKEYGPYDTASTLFVVIDHETKMPVGSLRIIRPSKAGLKSLVDLASTPLQITPSQFYKEYSLNPRECVDLAIIAVERRYRGKKFDFIPSLLLYRTLYTQVLLDSRYAAVVSIIDKKPYHLLLNLGMPFKPIFDSHPFTYLNSGVSYAVFARTSDFLPSVSQKVKRYRWAPSPTKQYMRRMMQKLIDGKGLDHMMGYPS